MKQTESLRYTVHFGGNALFKGLSQCQHRRLCGTLNLSCFVDRNRFTLLSRENSARKIHVSICRDTVKYLFLLQDNAVFLDHMVARLLYCRYCMCITNQLLYMSQEESTNKQFQRTTALYPNLTFRLSSFWIPEVEILESFGKMSFGEKRGLSAKTHALSSNANTAPRRQLFSPNCVSAVLDPNYICMSEHVLQLV